MKQIIPYALLFLMAVSMLSCSKSDTRNSDVDNEYSPPEWAKGIVWYQIFPERFWDGDGTNQPNRELARGPEGWHPTEWTDHQDMVNLLNGASIQVSAVQINPISALILK